MSKRCPNFSINEEIFLLQLVDLRKDALENKRRDEKEKAWIDIEKEYNEKFVHIFRNAKELKTKYKNLKQKRKTEEHINEREGCGIGGGTKIIISTTNNESVTHEMSALFEDDEVINDENNIDPLTSSSTNKSQDYELQKCKVEELELKIKKQELEIEMTKKEHNLMIEKMELELEISKEQLQQIKKALRNIILD